MFCKDGHVINCVLLKAALASEVHEILGAVHLEGSTVGSSINGTTAKTGASVHFKVDSGDIVFRNRQFEVCSSVTEGEIAVAVGNCSHECSCGGEAALYCLLSGNRLVNNQLSLIESPAVVILVCFFKADGHIGIECVELGFFCICFGNAAAELGGCGAFAFSEGKGVLVAGVSGNYVDLVIGRPYYVSGAGKLCPGALRSGDGKGLGNGCGSL